MIVRYGKGQMGFLHVPFCKYRTGQVNVTPVQVANEMAYIANKGWYITPHLVDSIEGGDKFDLLKN